jgi:hypothetical protein
MFSLYDGRDTLFGVISLDLTNGQERTEGME